MLTLLLLLVPCPATPQDALRDLIRQLDDDSSEVRERATKALSALEPETLPLLRDAAASASPEAKPRLLRAIRQVENRHVLRSKLRPASLVTIDAKDQPTRQILEDLARQGARPVDLASLPEAERMSVSLSKVPFWEALERVCRINGRMTYELDSGRVVVKPGKPALPPHRFSGPLGVHLQSVKIGKDDRALHLGIAPSWEQGNNPDGVSLRLREVRDNVGTSLLGDNPEPVAGVSSQRFETSYELRHSCRLVPDPRATELARLSMRVEFEFILRSVTHEFKDLDLTAGKKLTSEGVSVHLDQFEDTGSEVRGSLVIEAAEGRSIHPDLIQVVIRNEEKKEARFAVGSGKGSRLQCGFAVGGEPQKFGRIADLRVTVPTEVHTESIDLDLRDIPLKR